MLRNLKSLTLPGDPCANPVQNAIQSELEGAFELFTESSRTNNIQENRVAAGFLPEYLS